MPHQREKIINWAVFFFPALFLLICLELKRLPGPAYFLLIQEDHLLENLQFAFYLMASVGAASVAVRFVKFRESFHAAMFFVLSVGLFLIAGEEISWGQRIFHFVISEYLKIHNVQHETNIHNLGVIQPKMIYVCLWVGFYGGFGWILLKTVRDKTRDRLAWFVPDWRLGPYFFPTFLLNIYFKLNDAAAARGSDAFPVGPFIVCRDQEVTEFLQSLGFLIFIVFIWRKQRLFGARNEGPRDEIKSP